MRNLHETVINHRSIRKYKNQDISEKDMKMITDAIMHVPTSINGQQFSVIVVRDEKKKEKLSELTGNQPWVKQAPVFLVFVADFSRVAKAMELRGMEFENIKSVESTLVGAVDCGIAFGSVMDMAESLGYGIVPIGAVRRKPQEVIDLLELPKYVFPIVGMCIGVPDEDPALKPRFDVDTVVHYDTYKPMSEDDLKKYDDIVLDYMNERTNGQDVRNWTDLVSRTYSRVYFPEVKPVLESQGFVNEK